MIDYRIIHDPSIPYTYSPRGGCEQFIYCKEPEFIAVGPAETGKTLAACWKIHLLAIKYAGLNGAIVRKTQKSLYGSVLQTFERVIKNSPVETYGGEKPEKYIYPNGSVIWVGGMDNADKVLSSERDFIYVNQAEELLENDWELLLTRTTGRGAIMPYTMLFGDCNPSGSKHWIRERNLSSKLRLIQTSHRDNPSLYDEQGNITEQGIRTMQRLDALSGVRRKRLKEGLWATAEGAVYDSFDSAIHVIERNHIEFQSFWLTMDEGYTNPAVILLVGVDNDGRWHIFREFYERNKLQSYVVSKTKEWFDYVYEKQLSNGNKEIVKCSGVSVDESAAGLIADLINNGVPAQGAKGRVLDGIQHIQDKLKVQSDGKPRLTIDPSCTNVISEFESYVWKISPSGYSKDEPLKENDHAMDAIRYLDDAMVPIQIF